MKTDFTGDRKTPHTNLFAPIANSGGLFILFFFKFDVSMGQAEELIKHIIQYNMDLNKTHL